MREGPGRKRRRRMVVQYRVCPVCGAHLDPGEVCDCRRVKKETAPLVSGRPKEGKAGWGAGVKGGVTRAMGARS